MKFHLKHNTAILIFLYVLSIISIIPQIDILTFIVPAVSFAYFGYLLKYVNSEYGSKRYTIETLLFAVFTLGVASMSCYERYMIVNETLFIALNIICNSMIAGIIVGRFFKPNEDY